MMACVFPVVMVRSLEAGRKTETAPSTPPAETATETRAGGSINTTAFRFISGWSRRGSQPTSSHARYVESGEPSKSVVLGQRLRDAILVQGLTGELSHVRGWIASAGPYS